MNYQNYMYAICLVLVTLTGCYDVGPIYCNLSEDCQRCLRRDNEFICEPDPEKYCSPFEDFIPQEVEGRSFLGTCEVATPVNGGNCLNDHYVIPNEAVYQLVSDVIVSKQCSLIGTLTFVHPDGSPDETYEVALPELRHIGGITLSNAWVSQITAERLETLGTLEVFNDQTLQSISLASETSVPFLNFSLNNFPGEEGLALDLPRSNTTELRLFFNTGLTRVETGSELNRTYFTASSYQVEGNRGLLSVSIAGLEEVTPDFAGSIHVSGNADLTLLRFPDLLSTPSLTVQGNASLPVCDLEDFTNLVTDQPDFAADIISIGNNACMQ